MYTQLEQRGMPEPPVNVSTLRKMKSEGEPIACVTAYDASYAALVDIAGNDLVLVGDSLGMVLQGQDDTLPVTIDDMAYHTRSVRAGVENTLIIGDMPFMTYATTDMAYINAPRSGEQL